MGLDLSNARVHRGKISESDRKLDYEFWRRQPIEAKMAAIWEMAIFQYKVVEGHGTEPRLDRAVGGFQKKRR